MKKYFFILLLLVSFIPNSYAQDKSALAMYRNEDGNTRNACFDNIMYMWFMFELNQTAIIKPSAPSEADITRFSNNMVNMGLVPKESASRAKMMGSLVFSEASSAVKSGIHKSWEDKTFKRINLALSVCSKAMEQANR